MNKRFIEIREKLGFNKTNFAQELGINSHNIRDIENGKQKIPTEIAELLEEKFSISGWWLLTGKGNMFLKNESKICKKIEDHIGDREIELLDSFRKLNEKKQDFYFHRIKSDAIEEELNNQSEDGAKYA